MNKLNFIKKIIVFLGMLFLFSLSNQITNDPMIVNASGSTSEDVVVIFSGVGSHTWTVPAGIYQVEYLIVGGGGGGGGGYDNGGGAGGAGGMVRSGMLPVSPLDDLNLVVGSKGAGSTSNYSTSPKETSGGSGGDSELSGIVAFGGEGGYPSRVQRYDNTGSNSPGKGGLAQPIDFSRSPRTGLGGGNSRGGGGGGGAFSSGLDNSGNAGGEGGSGITSSIAGSSIEYGRGGNGGTRNPSTAGALVTELNTGRGGNGGGHSSGGANNGSAGSDGIVVIKYTIHRHTVEFDANGADNSMNSQVIQSGVATSLNAAGLTRAGYTFTGWNTLANGQGTAYANQASLNIASGKTLYAQWRLNPQPVIPQFRTQGTPYTIPLVEKINIQLPIDDIIVEAGEEVTLPVATLERQFGFIRQKRELPVQVIGEVDESTPGTYEVIYQVEYNGQTFSQSVTVIIKDLTAPTLLVNTKTNMFVGEELRHDVFSEDRGQPVDVKTESSINENVPGVYPVTYTATDDSGNQTSQTIYVVVQEPKPQITMVRFNTYHQFVLQLDPRYINPENITIEVAQVSELVGYVEWIAYEEGMSFTNYNVPVYIRARDEQGREWTRKVQLTIQQ